MVLADRVRGKPCFQLLVVITLDQRRGEGLELRAVERPVFADIAIKNELVLLQRISFNFVGHHIIQPTAHKIQE